MASLADKGTNSSKVSGTTLTISSVAMKAGECLAVFAGYSDAQGHPTIKWGNRQLKQRIVRDPTFDVAGGWWTIARVRDTATRDFVATWPSAIAERAMFAVCIDGANLIDEKQGNIDGVDTGGPVTGVTATLSVDDGFAVCGFVSEGPSSDSAGTAEIKDGGSFTSATMGQRDGTTGAPPVSNVTVQGTSLVLSSSTATEGRLVSATSRKWTSMILVFKNMDDWKQGITPTDTGAVQEIVDAAGGDSDAISYSFNSDTGLWEADEATTGTINRDAGGTWT